MMNELSDQQIIDRLVDQVGAIIDDTRIEYDTGSVVILDLSDLEMNQVPTDVFRLRNLRILNLNGNRLTAISVVSSSFRGDRVY